MNYYEKISFIRFYCISLIFAQDYKFAWLTDTHIGSPTGTKNLKEVINSINRLNDLKFVIVTGDITEKGRNEELDSAKIILDMLNIPYFIIPGNHDTKWSESGCIKFNELWQDNKFLTEQNGIIHIGVNSGITWRGGGGHISQQDLNWLKDTLKSIGISKEILFFVHHPLMAETDNWFEVTNILRNYNIKAIFNGHGHSNTSGNFAGIPAFMSRSTLEKGRLSSGYSIVENRTDSLLITERLTFNDSTFAWGKL